jgi:hypothetical protein
MTRVATLSRIAAAGALALLVASLGLEHALRVDRHGSVKRTIVSVWQGGVRRARTVVEKNPNHVLLSEARAMRGMRVAEDVIDEGPVLSTEAIIFGASFVPLKDGVEARYDDRVAYATLDDLLAHKAYDHALVLGPIRLQLGVDPDVVFDLLAGELDVTRDELVEHGTFRRIALRRSSPAEVTPVVNQASLRRAAVDAGAYLARAVKPDGFYRYEVSGIDDQDADDYNWPRHAGATWYLAETANYTRDPVLLEAVARAAHRLAEGALAQCGAHRCIAVGDRADLGSSALGLLALVEIVEGGTLPELMPVIRELSEFLRSQQRPDGEFKHFYDRVKNEPIDEQSLYYTGEASFALARAERLTHDKRDLDAASRALEYLVRYPPWYVGWHYFWGAEHWTCHALDALWERAPSRKALDFCLQWQEAVRTTAIWDREASPEYDGATSAGPFVPPALVGTATRMEAAVSTLRVARLAGVPATELEKLEDGMKKALAFLMRYQLDPGPAEVMKNPAFMRGGVPNTPADLHVRIDNPQHAGTALLGYLKLLEAQKR